MSHISTSSASPPAARRSPHGNDQGLAEPGRRRNAANKPCRLACSALMSSISDVRPGTEVLQRRGDEGIARNGPRARPRPGAHRRFPCRTAGPAHSKHRRDSMSVITGFDVVMVTLRDGELPHERRSALLLERGALHSGVLAMPSGAGYARSLDNAYVPGELSPGSRLTLHAARQYVKHKPCPNESITR